MSKFVSHHNIMMRNEDFGCQFVNIHLSMWSSMLSLPVGSHIQVDRQHSTFNSVLGYQLSHGS